MNNKTLCVCVAAGIVLFGACGNSNPTDDDGTYSLTTLASNGIIGKSPDKAGYQSGETVTLTAIPFTRYVFSNWSGDASGKNETTTITINGNKSVTANFISSIVTDINGNNYHIVKIGTQVWTTENLRATRYNDSTQIPLVTDSAAWNSRAIPGYCFYNNTTNADSIYKFGALYNWHAVNTGKLAPAGWHVPTEAEWDTLQNYLIASGYNWDGTTTGNKIAKSLAAKTDWSVSTNPGAVGNDMTRNNGSGFSALPGGIRLLNGGFNYLGTNTGWWSASSASTMADARLLASISSSFQSIGYNMSYGLSLRLVKD